MTPVRQPPCSRCCGQACIATIGDITLNKAIALVGHQKATNSPILRKALKTINIETNQLRRYHGEELPKRAILRLRLPKTRGAHWVVWWDNQIIDPGGNPPCPWPITSYFEIIL